MLYVVKVCIINPTHTIELKPYGNRIMNLVKFKVLQSGHWAPSRERQLILDIFQSW